ncbi:hypothetical protein ACVGVM_16760 [Pseudonocardia bannensis]|uniref:DUF948 domain-containing protein n=1 Tax=Pseudonocardia bannensis TaxID=630973 RepID=A0A848DRX9_9PSEU|nr:hypothetical protein [Pseudonocardia bannensis]NMH95176.1 hypothetical protein [Pseudonocardia bannensis]
MTTLVVLTVVVIAALIAGLAFYLFWVGSLLGRVATNLEACEEAVTRINTDAELIGPGVEHINRSAGTVAGALPLLYGFAEKIVVKASPNVVRPAVAVPASGRRRSRLHEAVGFAPAD